MTTKRARVFRSSSTGGFGLLNQLVRSPEIIPSEKKRATVVASPVILTKVNIGSKAAAAAVRVLPEHPRRSIFTVGSAAEKEKDEKKEDEQRWEFPLSCFHCKKEIGENKDVFMYGSYPYTQTNGITIIQLWLAARNQQPHDFHHEATHRYFHLSTNWPTLKNRAHISRWKQTPWYLRAFCSTKCREIQIELEDRDREPSPGPRNRYRAPAAVAAATQARQEPAKQVVRSPVKKYTIAKFN